VDRDTGGNLSSTFVGTLCTLRVPPFKMSEGDDSDKRHVWQKVNATSPPELFLYSHEPELLLRWIAVGFWRNPWQQGLLFPREMKEEVRFFAKITDSPESTCVAAFRLAISNGNLIADFSQEASPYFLEALSGRAGGTFPARGLVEDNPGLSP